jgi:flagellar biosynthesis protein FlhA
MADTSITPPKNPLLSPAAFGRSLLRGDVAVGLGVMGLIVLLLMPLPVWLLDVLLALSITSSVLILMTALFIKKPLEFSVFPTILLIATLFRLGLNVASTRLILAEGHNGPDAAGDIIAAFGDFIMGGNFVIGVIVFIILVLVNFIVITKGSTRIAEVAARFSLDAMPGKQMAIDADLSSGLLTEDEARAKRRELEQESNFFGSMDGASKFVRGDAIAGLLITAINIIGGMIIGMAQEGLPFTEAADTYTRLSVGDGLVSQIPALIVSVAAGMLVTKAGVEGSADEALGKQLASYPQALGIVAVTAFIGGLLPGMPLIPFWVIAAGSAYLAFRLWREQERLLITPKAEPVDIAPAAEEPITSALAMDELKIELGFGLLALVNEVQGRKLTDQIKALRRQIAQDLGFVMPAVRILDNMALASESYVIRVKELEAGKGELRLGRLLTMDSRGGAPDLPGEVVREPAFGMPAAWIEDGLREEALFRGCTVVDPATVLTTHLTEVVKENMAELLSIAEVQKLIRELPKEHQKLVEDTIPSSMSWAALQRVLQNLLRERVSIRDLGAIVEAASEVAGQDAVTITEHVRGRLGRQLCAANQAPDGALPILTLSAEWEQAFAESLIGERDRQLALPPSQVHDFVAAVRDAFDRAAGIGESPVLLTSPMIRPYVRSLVERFRGHTVVLSQNEVHPRAKLRSVGAV